MSPTAVLNKSPTTHTKMNTTMINNQSTSIPSTNSHGFGFYQLTTVGASDETILTLVPVPINPPLYWKALVAMFFFPQTLDHVDTSFISISNLVSTIATYFDIYTTMTERKACTAQITCTPAK